MKILKSKGKIILEMQPHEAEALNAAITADNYRRWKEFEETTLMACWDCTAIELRLMSLFEQANIEPLCGGKRL